VSATSEGSSKWEVLSYGILAVISKKDDLSLMIGDVDSGELLHEFHLLSSSRYTIQKSHFHTFVSSDGKVVGMSFVDVSVAEKVSQVLRQLSSVATGEVAEGDDVIPPAKRAKVAADNYSEWVIISSEDVPPITETNKATGAIEREGRGEGIEETDFGLFSRKHEKEKFKIDDISGPSYFRHLTNTESGPVEPGTSKSGVESGDGGEDVEKRTGTFERGTKRSSSFMEFESQTEPQAGIEDAATSTGGITSSTSVASSFSGSSFGMPEPPAHLSDHDTLLSQISTFDRRRLHHISPEEIAKMKNKTDSRRKRSITSMFRNGFDQLLPKLQALRQISTVATITSAGEEEWCDGVEGPHLARRNSEDEEQDRLAAEEKYHVHVQKRV
jgi:hypothetical protein